MFNSKKESFISDLLKLAVLSSSLCLIMFNSIKGHTRVVTFEVNFLGIFNVGYHQEVAALK